MDKMNVQNIYNLSPLQKGILFHYISDNSVAYNEMLSITMNSVNIERFLNAWKKVIDEYDILRAVFRWEKLKQPVQIVQKHMAVPLITKSYAHHSGEYEEFKDKLLSEGIDLKVNPWTVYLIDFDDGTYEMLLYNHHIILDGWSTSLILNRFFQVYDALEKNMPVQTVKNPDYHHFIQYLKKHYQVDEGFWRDLLVDCHFVNNRSEALKCHKKIVELNTTAIETYAKSHKLTLSSVLHGVYLYMESRIENTTRPVIGTVVSGRPKDLKGINQMAGLMINTLPITVDFKEDTQISHVLTRIQKIFSNLNQQALIHLSDIQDVLHVNRSESLFNKLLVIENYPLDMSLLTSHPLGINHIEMTEQTNFDLTIIIKMNDVISIEYIYGPDVFTDDDIEQYHERILRVLDQLVSNPLLSDIEILSEPEKDKLLNCFNTYDTPFEKTSIGDYFSMVAKKYSERVAVKTKDQSMTYNMLDALSTAAAEYLIQMGLKTGALVGISCDRSIEMMVALLGIVKAGGVYVPIDKAYPDERKTFIVKDAQIDFLIHHNSPIESVTHLISAEKLLDLKLQNTDLPKVSEKELAYCIYTSGSTGKPKGVLIEHQSVMRLLTGKELIPYHKHEIMLQTTALSFDVSTFDIWGGLFHGLTLRLIDSYAENIALGIQDILCCEKIDVAWFTTALFNHLVDTDITMFKQMTTVLVGGDTLSVDHINHLKTSYPHIQVFNGYGPTENTTFTTTHCIESFYDKAIPIGKPVDNTQVYVVNDKDQLQPIDYPGELLFGGVGVARSYLNRPELNQKKFIRHPFRPNEQLYRSGDMGYFNSSGILEFLGRKDHQIKIRGYRIEIGEIEATIKGLEFIEDCVVLLEEKQQQKELIAYYKIGRFVEVNAIKNELNQLLPAYMIPKYWMAVENIPITINGKVDKQQLQQFDMDESRTVIYPETELEKHVIEEIKEILRLNELSELSRNFFELGGDSLKVAALIHKVHEVYGVNISYKSVMQAENLKDICDLISTGDRVYQKVYKGRLDKAYPLMGMQRSMLMHQLRFPDSTRYNMSVAYELLGTLDVDRLVNALKTSLSHHSVFNTMISEEEGLYSQKYIETDHLIEVIERVDDHLDLSSFIEPFKMIDQPLFRIKLFIMNEFQAYLLIDIHHLIGDGLSTDILLKDIQNAYQEKPLSESSDYCDYLEWQLAYENSKVFEEDQVYWQQMKDYRGGTFYTNENTADVITDHDLSLDRKVIDGFAKKHHTTSSNVFLTAYACLVSTLMRSDEVAIALPVSTREEQLSSTVGLLVNTLILKCKLDKNEGFHHQLSKISNQLMTMLNHKHYPIDLVIDGQDNLLDVFYAFENDDFDADRLILDGLNTRQVDLNQNVLKSKISLVVKACDKHYKVRLTHDRSLSYETGHSMMTGMKEIIEDILDEGGFFMLNESSVFEKMTYSSTLMDKFKRMVEEKGNDVAVKDASRTLTYNELWFEAMSYGHLIEEKTNKGDVVGLYMNRSASTIAAMIGALITGRVYMPLDQSLPNSRLLHMTTQAEAKLVIADAEMSFDYKGAVVDSDISEYSSCQLLSEPSQIGYIIFTSGSTGKPKGVSIRQRSINNLVEALRPQFDGKRKDVALLSSFGFDASVQTIYNTLLNGHTLHIVPEDTKRSGEDLLKFYNEQKIDISDGTPAHLRLIGRTIASESILPSQFVIGGEALLNRDVAPLFENTDGITITNVYGPTECCVDSTAFNITSDNYKTYKSYPIGKPLQNYFHAIVDHRLKSVPEGMVGELLIAGDGVAAGYVNAPTLTEERFVVMDNERWYRTGDMVYENDGLIHYVGREDDQVKVNGYRIELNEIKHVIQGHDDVVDCHVFIDGDAIVACYIGHLRKEALNDYLSDFLASFMMPSRLIQVDQIPLTASGKIDVDKLKSSGSSSKNYQPMTEAEVKLHHIISDLLGHDDFNANDSFFMIGGNSLKAMQLIERIRLAFDVKLSIKEVFNNNSFEEILKMIENHGMSAYTAIPHASKATYDMSSGQKRMYTLYLMNPEKTNYNMYQAFELKGEVDLEAMQSAILMLMDHHEVLRTNFAMEEGRFVQKIAHHIDEFHIELLEAKDVEDVVKMFVKPFILETDLLLRVGYVKLENRNLLIIDMHHIISDGLSVLNMIHYLKRFIGGEEVIKPKIQYKDYADWQMALTETDEYKASLKKWRDALKTSKKVSFSEKVSKTFAGNTKRMYLSSQMCEQIYAYTENQELTEFMLFLSVYYIVLSRVEEARSITIGTPVSGRNHPDIEDGLGMYINTLLLLMDLDEEASTSDYLSSVKTMVLDALDEQHVQLDDIVEVMKQAGIDRQLFNVLFAYEKKATEIIQLSETLTLTPIKMTMEQAKLDLTLVVISTDNGIELNFDYATEQMDLSYVEKFSDEYISVMEQLLSGEVQTLKSLIYKHDLRNDKLQQMDEVLEEFDGEFAF